MKGLEELQSTIERLFLGNEDLFGDTDLIHEIDYGLKHSLNILSSSEENNRILILESKLRLLMHFCPAEVFSVKKTDPKIRWKLIAEFLKKHNLKKHDDLIEPLSRDIASVLDLWEISRKQVWRNRDKHFSKQGWKCNHCYLQYPKDWKKGDIVSSKFLNDPYKPYVDSIDFQPEVDHIEPVSRLGHNEEDNLHVLCRLCNQGKKEDFGIRAINEMQFAGKDISGIDKSFKWKMFFYVVRRANNTCQKCNLKGKELTIRLIRKDGIYTRTNLEAICYDCCD